MNIRKLDEADYGYALFTWREGHKKSPGADRIPWSYYKVTTGQDFRKILDDPDTVALGAYTSADKLLGWLVVSPGKRVHTLHWVHVKHALDDTRVRRRGIMSALLDAANLGSKFAYTLRGRRLDRDERVAGAKSLDEVLVAALRARGVTATYVPLKEWLK